MWLFELGISGIYRDGVQWKGMDVAEDEDVRHIFVLF